MRGMLASLRPIASIVAATAVASSQALCPLAESVAYASDGDGQEEQADLHAMWDAVLTATDDEATAKARMSEAQERLAAIAREANDLDGRAEALETERDRLDEGLDDLIEFANNPTSGSKAYTDAVMAVVDSIEAVADAQDALDGAKGEYATARQAVADAKAKLEESGDEGLVAQAQSDLEAAEGAVSDGEVSVKAAQEALDEANDNLARELDGAAGDAQKAYDDAQAALSNAQDGLDEAAKAKRDAEAKVSEDREHVGDGSKSTEPFSMSEIGTDGAYMDGVDISSYENGMDLAAVPMDFAIVKSLEGPNPEGDWYHCDYHGKADKVLELGKGLGLYHFYTTNASPEEQAERFVEVSKDYVGKAAFFLDWESRSYGGGRGTSPVATLDPSVAKAWLDRVYELTGVKPSIYMSHAVVIAHDWSEVAKDYPLWVAGYPSSAAASGYDTSWHVPYGSGIGAWTRGPLIWQYSSTTYLANWRGALDVNVMFGDMSDWEKLASQDWGRRLKQDEEALAKATEAEHKAQEGVGSARSALDQATTELQERAPGLKDAFAAASERQAALDEARSRLDEATQERDARKQRVDELQRDGEELQSAVADAQEGLDEASKAVARAEDALGDAQSQLAARQRRKDMFKRIFDIVHADGGTGDKAQGDETGSDGGQAGAQAAAASVGSALGGIADLVHPSVALAATKVSPLTKEPLPGASDIVADPSVLDGAMEAAGDESVRQLLGDIRDDAVRLSEIGSELSGIETRRKELASEKRDIEGRMTKLEEGVADAQGAVEEARAAYAKASPGGVIEAPEGYVDRRVVPSDGETAAAGEDNSLLILWGGMFAAAVTGTVIVVRREEERERAARR